MSHISDAPLSGMNSKQCHICGKYVNHERISSIDRALSGHLKMHVRHGEAKRDTEDKKLKSSRHYNAYSLLHDLRKKLQPIMSEIVDEQERARDKEW